MNLHNCIAIVGIYESLSSKMTVHTKSRPLARKTWSLRKFCVACGALLTQTMLWVPILYTIVCLNSIISPGSCRQHGSWISSSIKRAYPTNKLLHSVSYRIFSGYLDPMGDWWRLQRLLWWRDEDTGAYLHSSKECVGTNLSPCRRLHYCRGL